MKNEKYILVLAEKPDASRRIAESIADKKPKVIERNGVNYYEFTVNGKKHVCVPAVGHLFVLNPKKNNKGWTYPVFELEWVPTYTRKGTEWTEKYFRNIQELAKTATEFVDAADVDNEGEVLLYNILRFICGVEDAKRMKFSTLTKDELAESYKKLDGHIMFPMVESGLARHYLDGLYGFNLTRALTLALKDANPKGFTILSTGRVQGPTLQLLMERELEIRKFKPTPFWQLELHVKLNGKEAVATFEKEKIWEKKEAEKIFVACENKDAIVRDVKKREHKQNPPPPFNTTDLQSEAYVQFGFSPTQTLSIVESLYQVGYISYPRSSSQKLPPSINYQKILKAIGKLSPYQKFVQELLKKQLKPIEGPRDDPAHPAVYATHETPDMSKLNAQQKKAYDLIVRRTLATFGDAAVRETSIVSLDVNGNKFVLNGIKTLEPGWTEVYSPYLARDEVILPDLKIGQKLKVIKLEMLSKATQPPNRYSQGSIVKELEKRNLGTKCVESEEPILISMGNDIKKVNIGDFIENNSIYRNAQVLCYNDSNIEWKTPSNLNKRKLKRGELLEVNTSNFKIKVTKEHPIATWDGKNVLWKPAKDVIKGDKIIRVFYKNYDKKSRVIANILGDGSIYIRKDVKNRTADIRYHNKSPELIEEFANAAKMFYSTPYIAETKNGMYYARLSLTDGRKIIEDFPEIVKGYFPENIDSRTSIGAFFDDEGCVYLEKIKQWKNVKSSGIPKIKIAQKLSRPLYQILTWLEELKINSSVRKAYVNYKGSRVAYYELWIRGRRNIERFAFHIPFFHKGKTRKLLRGLTRYPVVVKKAKMYSIISKRPIFSQEISKVLNESIVNTRSILRELEEDGFIKITRTPNIKTRHANNSLLIKEKIPFENTFYSILEAGDVTSQVFTEEVSEIKDATSEKDYVYDITVGLDTPNFIAGKGNFLIHNSTRAEILQTLYDRNYITGKAIQVTKLGEAVTLALQEYSPKIVSEDLTKHFEDEMEQVYNGEKKRDNVVEEAKRVLVDVLEEFKRNEKEIGKKLLDGLTEARKEANRLGTCPKCKTGELRIMFSKKTGKHFVGCSNYGTEVGCKTIYPLPRMAKIQSLGKVCDKCGTPIIQVIRKGRRPFKMCLDTNCPTKAGWRKKSNLFNRL